MAIRPRWPRNKDFSGDRRKAIKAMILKADEDHGNIRIIRAGGKLLDKHLSPPH